MDLLNAFRSSSQDDNDGANGNGLLLLDDGTIEFLLEALEHATAEEWQPILDPFVQNPLPVLQILQASSDPQSVIVEAKTLFVSTTTTDHDPDPTSTPTPVMSEHSETKESFDDNNEDLGPPVSSSASHFLSLPERLSYTCIPGAHSRGITLDQLRSILEYIQSQADDDDSGRLPWIDYSNEQSPTYGQRLQVSTMNLYHVVDYIVKPWTESHQCSMVELLTDHPQIPQWFVSHAWKEPICDMVASLTEHTRIRGLPSDTTVYWICGYANNQHRLEQDILSHHHHHSSPKQTSFYKALQQCEGMILCLDSVRTPFQRIWCCYEQSMIVQNQQQLQERQTQQQPLLLDIATVTNHDNDGTAVVIADGRAPHVVADLREGPRFALELKRDREGTFPLSLLEKGYGIDICAAQAAKEEDRIRILNDIRGGETSDNDAGIIVFPNSNSNSNDDHHHDDDRSHPAFSRINKVLRGIFAEAAAQKAVEAGRIDTVVQVLKQDTDRTQLTLNFGGASYVDYNDLVELADHPSLQQLTIDCSFCNVANIPMLTRTLVGLRTSLQILHLSFQWCTSLMDDDIIHLSQHGLKELHGTISELSLDFSGCTTCSVFLPRIEDLQSLEKLTINYSETQTKSNGKTLLGYLQLRYLRELRLSFRACSNATQMYHLKQLKDLSHLHTLVLDFDFTNLSDISCLECLVDLKHLSYCHLSFAKCTQITNIPWLPLLIYKEGITSLNINLSGCKGLDPCLQTRFTSQQDLLEVFWSSPQLSVSLTEIGGSSSNGKMMMSSAKHHSQSQKDKDDSDDFVPFASLTSVKDYCKDLVTASRTKYPNNNNNNNKGNDGNEYIVRSIVDTYQYYKKIHDVYYKGKIPIARRKLLRSIPSFLVSQYRLTKTDIELIEQGVWFKLSSPPPRHVQEDR